MNRWKVVIAILFCSIISVVVAKRGSLSDTFWGVVAGSFFSLAGVELSNRAAEIRLRDQLGHDWKLKERDRELTLKKGIYLSAVEAAAIGIQALTKFPNLQIPPESIDGDFQAKSTSFNQVYLVGSQETIAAASALSQEINAAIIRLHAKRFPLVLLKGRSEVHQKMIDGCIQEMNQLNERMKQINIDGTRDDRMWEQLQGNFGFQSKACETNRETRAKIEAQILMGSTELVQDLTTEIANINSLVPKFLVSARSELALPLDEAWVATHFKHVEGFKNEVVKDFLADVQTTMREFGNQE